MPHTINSETFFSFCFCSVLCRRLGIEVKDFGPSWRTGLAFFAVIHALRPNLVDMERVWGRPNQENLQEAFLLAETELGVPQLLDPEGKLHFVFFSDFVIILMKTKQSN